VPGETYIKKIKRMIKACVTFNVTALRNEFVGPVRKLWNHVLQNSVTNKIITGVVEIRNKIIFFVNRTLFLKKIKIAAQGKTLIIIPSVLFWHMPLFQRPQQLAKAYARRSDTCVVYLSPTTHQLRINVGENIENNLFVFDIDLVESLLPIVEKVSKVIVSISWTYHKEYYEILKADSLIYEYIDELEVFLQYGPDMIKDHMKLLTMADVTVATATKLFDQIKDTAKNPICSTNGGDYHFFINSRNILPNLLLKNNIIGYKCVLGYYGAFARWFDYDLIIDIAKKQPSWVWILIGLELDETLQKSNALKISNIKYLGHQEYKDLPSYLAAFDIATIPFQINEITLSTSPVKLFEYMAGGKPILTSRMPECLKYKSVYTYNDADEFIEKAEKILALPPSDPYWALLEKEALENTWDAKVQEILNAIPEKGKYE
jgi:glycosyltransferase involved in cell wall biosynthesis